jgi:hypothetical protein
MRLARIHRVNGISDGVRYLFFGSLFVQFVPMARGVVLFEKASTNVSNPVYNVLDNHSLVRTSRRLPICLQRVGNRLTKSLVAALRKLQAKNE